MQNRPQKPLENISGFIERITYHNSDNGYAVLKAKIKGQRDLVTITGNVPCISVGEQILASGSWNNNLKHGLQFKAEFLKSLRPNTLFGIEKYLSSGLIRGIGQYFAKKMVDAFGESVFDIIELSPERLREVNGIGILRVKQITKSWNEQKIVREIMVFLQSHGVSTTKATRIFKTYGQDAIRVVSENPYQLAKDIYGIGFLSADKIAKNLGIAEDSIVRARAGINYTLMEALSDGHCALPEDLLLQNAIKLLSISETILKEALLAELNTENLTVDSIDGKPCIFLTAYYIYERAIAKKLKALSVGEAIWKNIDVSKAIPWVEEKLAIKLADIQKEAIRIVMLSKVTVITGGPGTGKTTLVNSILKILKAKKIQVKLCAPTGRAAKRLSESTHSEALTIHRLLQFNPGTRDFKFNEHNQLDCDLLIIDECSMIDVQIMQSLLKALPPSSGLIMVGDVDQLPSVGAGQILHDVIQSKVMPTVRLEQIFRQAANSDIIINAHLVNQGKFPKLKPPKETTDFYFIESKLEDAAPKIIDIVKNRIPKKFGFNSISDIQVLCPMLRGGIGVRSLNIELQKALNPSYLDGIERFGQIYAPKDKVMQIENDYDKEVYNGDIGFIQSINKEAQELIINFDNRDVRYDFSDLDQVTLSYASTIHKSQGSEYPVVVMPIMMQHFLMLKKNLIYTGITRGKKLVIIIGEKKALAMGIKSKGNLSRFTKLKEFLGSQH
jgi:exodeoxyribonuclease V alpha subunit